MIPEKEKESCKNCQKFTRNQVRGQNRTLGKRTERFEMKIEELQESNENLGKYLKISEDKEQIESS